MGTELVILCLTLILLTSSDQGQELFDETSIVIANPLGTSFIRILSPYLQLSLHQQFYVVIFPLYLLIPFLFG